MYFRPIGLVFNAEDNISRVGSASTSQVSGIVPGRVGARVVPERECQDIELQFPKAW